MRRSILEGGNKIDANVRFENGKNIGNFNELVEFDDCPQKKVQINQKKLQKNQNPTPLIKFDRTKKFKLIISIINRKKISF